MCHYRYVKIMNFLHLIKKNFHKQPYHITYNIYILFIITFLRELFSVHIHVQNNLTSGFFIFWLLLHM